MKLFLRTSLPILALFLALISAAAADTGPISPAGVTQAMYRAALSHFGFTAASIKAQEPWLSPELYSRLQKKVKEPTPKGDAPDIDGDVFLDSQDVPTAYEVGDATIDGFNATVGVTLQWTKEKRHYSVLLKQIGGSWKVYDIIYDHDGRLTDLLK